MNIKDYILGTIMILSIIFLVNSITLNKANEVLHSQEETIKELKCEVNELRILFNTKFLQEMIINKPQIRDLGYRNYNSQKNLVRFEI